jgi:hypothetical protein
MTLGQRVEEQRAKTDEHGFPQGSAEMALILEPESDFHICGYLAAA